jgi:ribosome assembly protein 1
MARRKRAEIAKAQAESEGMNGTTNGLVSTKIGENGEEDMTPRQLEDPEQSIGFATLFSGDFSIGDEVWVLPPKFNPAYPHAEPIPKKVPVKALYLLMGRGLEPFTIGTGSGVFGIEGFEGHILKTGTLCSQLKGGINLAGVNNLSKPIVRVALEPVNPMDLNKMIKGLKHFSRVIFA